MKKITSTLLLSCIAFALFAKHSPNPNKVEKTGVNHLKFSLLQQNEILLNQDTLKIQETIKDVSDRKIVVKLNLMKLAQRVLYLQGEYAFSKKLSVAVGISGTSRGLPNSITGNNSTIDYNHFRFSGFSITPELRYYPSKKREAPNGFYLAPYFKFATYNVSYPYSYTSTDMAGNSSISKYDLKGNYSGVGGGLMIGRQWVTKSGFTIDWWILGGHYGAAQASVSSKGDFTHYTKSEINDMIKDMESASVNLPFGSVHTTITNNEMSTKISNLPFIGVRGFGVCFGYAF